MAESYIIVINQFLNYYMEVKVMLKVLIIYAKLGKLLKKFFFKVTRPLGEVAKKCFFLVSRP